MVYIRVLQQIHKILNDNLSITGRHPSFTNDTTADVSITLSDFGVKDFSLEMDPGRLEGVVVAEVQMYDEISSLIRSARRPFYCHVPLCKNFTDKDDGDTLDGLQIYKFLVETAGNLHLFWRLALGVGLHFLVPVIYFFLCLLSGNERGGRYIS